jgi:hypothetical protein
MTMPTTSDAAAPPLAPQRVLLFSGHMVDAPGRRAPRFPPSKVTAAARRIDAALDALHAAATDLAITQGAAGGDLLFAHACQERRVPLQLMLPLAEAAFVRRAVARSAEPERWLAAWAHVRARLARPPMHLAGDAGASTRGNNAFERCNAWMLRSALAAAPGRVQLLCLWDGREGDGPGGTGHLVQQARHAGVPVTWIDTRQL